MARRLGLANVHFLQGDLLDVGDLGERFDAILASGCCTTWRTRWPGCGRSPGCFDQAESCGSASTASTRGSSSRRRAPWRKRPVTRFPGAVRAFRREVVEGGEAEIGGLLRSPDFYTVSSCRDLVFHVHERRFTIPEVAGALGAAGLRPIGFEAGRETSSRYRRKYPGDPHLRSLGTLAEFEKAHPEAFAGMYLLWAEAERIET